MATEVYGPSLATAITVSDFDLAGNQLVRVTNIGSEYVLDTLSLNFSTPALKRITLRSFKGVVVYDTGLVADQDIQVVFQEAFDYGDDLTLTITQTSEEDVVNGTLKVRPGAVLPVEFSIKQRIEDILTQLTDKSTNPKTVVEFLSLIYQTLAAGGGGGSGGSATVTTKPVRLTYGTVQALAPGASGVVTQVVASNNFGFRGITATGSGDGYFELQVNNTTLLSGRIHAIERNLNLSVLGAYVIENGITITLRVRNDSESLCSYEGVIIGE